MVDGQEVLRATEEMKESTEKRWVGWSEPFMAAALHRRSHTRWVWNLGKRRIERGTMELLS